MSDSLETFTKDFFAAGTAASISLCLTAPIERIKIILQVQKIVKKSECIGIAGCAHHIFNTQGFLSFWRGNLANTMRAFPTSSITFALKQKFKPYFVTETTGNHGLFKHFYGNVMSGASAGLTCLCIVYPLEFTRTRLAADIDHGGEQKFKGIIDCLNKIYRSDGIRGIYRGFYASALGIIIYRGGYFGFYDTVCEFTHDKNKLNISLKFLIAQSVVLVAALLAYPLDTVRRIMMMQSGKAKKDWAYNNSIHCIQEIARTKGLPGFYRGALSNILVGIGSALILVLFDEIREFLQ